MEEAIIEFFVLGEVPGTNFTIGYRTSLIIAAIFILSIVLYATMRYKNFVARRISDLSPERLIELKTI